ncbi:hypothetical protein BDW62DRAFT_197753 [Aspergillus aurantiobrunneus]
MEFWASSPTEQKTTDAKSVSKGIREARLNFYIPTGFSFSSPEFPTPFATSKSQVCGFIAAGSTTAGTRFEYNWVKGTEVEANAFLDLMLAFRPGERPTAEEVLNSESKDKMGVT